MPWIVGGAIIFLTLGGGCFLLYDAIQIYTRRRSALRRLRAVQGRIVALHSEVVGNGSAYFPEISYTGPGGERLTFRSEIGAGEYGDYKVGDRIPILVDPEGLQEPLINSWSGLWDRPLFESIGGLVLSLIGLTVGWVLFTSVRD